MIKTERFAQVVIDSEDALWSWLETHHGQADSVWFVTCKKPSPNYVSREQVLDALIAYGWIDGIRRKLDEAHTMQLVSPRKQQIWAQSYKDRVARLRREGRMRPAGEAAVAAGIASGRWTESAPVDALAVPEDLEASLGPLRADWDVLAPSYRRNVLRWIASAKRPETRFKRLEATVSSVANGEKMRNM